MFRIIIIFKHNSSGIFNNNCIGNDNGNDYSNSSGFCFKTFIIIMCISLVFIMVIINALVSSFIGNGNSINSTGLTKISTTVPYRTVLVP